MDYTSNDYTLPVGTLDCYNTCLPCISLIRMRTWPSETNPDKSKYNRPPNTGLENNIDLKKPGFCCRGNYPASVELYSTEPLYC